MQYSVCVVDVSLLLVAMFDRGGMEGAEKAKPLTAELHPPSFLGAHYYVPQYPELSVDQDTPRWGLRYTEGIASLR